MTTADMLGLRLINQHITQTTLHQPAALIQSLGALQAQDYAMSKWAIGLRLPGVRDADVEKAFNEGSILRTHVLRPTWHFVTPEDVRWMLALTAHRIKAAMASYVRNAELTNKILKRSNDTLAKVLQGKQLDRHALRTALERAKIATDGGRLPYLLMQAELDGIICSGPRIGKQFTYALLEERAPEAKALDRDEALAALTLRYFTSRGPATIHDFGWWSGLTMKDAREGVAMLSSHLIREVINEKEYVYGRNSSGIIKPSSALAKPSASFLMPDYDEYGISYKDRNALCEWPGGKGKATIPAVDKRGGNSIYNRMIVVEGRIAGAWKPVMNNKKTDVETTFFVQLNKSRQQAVKNAIKQYKSFIEEK